MTGLDRALLVFAGLMIVVAAVSALAGARRNRATTRDAAPTAGQVEPLVSVPPPVRPEYLTPAAAIGATVQRLAAHPPTGRHRRPAGELPTGTVSATGIFRRVRADETALPAIPRATRHQLAGRPE